MNNTLGRFGAAPDARHAAATQAAGGMVYEVNDFLYTVSQLMLLSIAKFRKPSSSCSLN
jgi:hypothetical protein